MIHYVLELSAAVHTAPESHYWFSVNYRLLNISLNVSATFEFELWCLLFAWHVAVCWLATWHVLMATGKHITVGVKTHCNMHWHTFLCISTGLNRKCIRWKNTPQFKGVNPALKAGEIKWLLFVWKILTIGWTYQRIDKLVLLCILGTTCWWNHCQCSSTAAWQQDWQTRGHQWRKATAHFWTLWPCYREGIDPVISKMLSCQS